MSDVNRIQIIPSQINRPSTQGGTTLTGTYANLPYNKNAIKRLQAIVGDNFEGDLNIFDNPEGSFNILPLDKLQQLLTNVLIRFDNNPNYYTKSDYQHLIWYLCQSLGYLVSKDVSSDVVELQKQIKDLEQRVNNKQDKEDQALTTTSKTIVGAINELDAWKGNTAEDVDRLWGDINTLNAWKPTVDSNIQSLQTNVDAIDNTTKSHSQEIGSLWDTIDNLHQGGSTPVYKAGSGIDIEDSTIKSVYTGDDFTVNVNIGSLKAGETKIEKGSNIVDILRQMLTKYIKCVIKSQTAVSFANQSKTVEYNGSINVTVTPKVTYGKVESEDPNYVPENTTITQEIDTDKPYSDLALGWSQNGSNLVKTFSNVVNQITNSNIAKCHLTPNSTPIKDNMGNEQEDLTIAEMVTISGQVTITPQQYVYYGFIDNSKIGGNNVQISNITDIMVKDLNRITKNYPVAVFTQTANLSTEGGQSLVIAVPSNRTLDKMVDQNNADIKSDHPNFQTKTIALDYSGAPVNYNVYLYPLRDPFTCNTFKLS